MEIPKAVAGAGIAVHAGGAAVVVLALAAPVVHRIAAVVGVALMLSGGAATMLACLRMAQVRRDDARAALRTEGYRTAIEHMGAGDLSAPAQHVDLDEYEPTGTLHLFPLQAVQEVRPRHGRAAR